MLQEEERVREIAQEKGNDQPTKQQSNQATNDDAHKKSQPGPAAQSVKDVEDTARDSSDQI